DSADISQSVLASFFVRAAAGQVKAAGPAQLRKLLVSMTRKTFAFWARRHLARKRDVRRLVPTRVEEINLVCRTPCPSRVVAGRDLLHQVRRRLSDDEREVADRRAEGQSWA